MMEMSSKATHAAFISIARCETMVCLNGTEITTYPAGVDMIENFEQDVLVNLQAEYGNVALAARHHGGEGRMVLDYRSA